jgi:hypothetical protein
MSDNQPVFVLGRSILDNAMISIEVIHHMKINKHMIDKNVALKHDISKAYDGIDWLYLKEFMIKIGFESCWIRWIMMCVETVDYSMIVNNESVRPIFSGRGLIQGDLLSPYFFYLVCRRSCSSYPQI